MIFKYIQYCRKFKEMGGHHDEKLELKQLLFLRVYLSLSAALDCFYADYFRFEVTRSSLYWTNIY